MTARIIGAALRSARHVSGAKARDAAKRVGVHVNTLYAWEKGERDIRSKHERALRKFYDEVKARTKAVRV